jgi:flagellar biosynthesis/type III secretory pathway protein FliH
MKKVDKMFEEQPTWLRSTTNDIARNVAKQQMQAVAGAIATKYISARIQEGLTQAQAKQQQAAIKAGIQKGLEEAAKKAEISKSTNKIPIGFTAPVKK